MREATIMTRPSRIAAVLIASTSALLASCSVGVVDTGATPTEPASQSSEAANESEKTTDPPATTDLPEESTQESSTEESSTEDADDGAAPELARSAWEDLSTVELDCASGTEVISQTGQVVTITADCDQVSVTAVGAVVLTQAVGDLEVSGTGTAVILTSVEQVTITGTGISVGWETGSPQVTDTGTGSTARILTTNER